MELKNDLKADAIANLYRSALYLGRGSKEIGISFLKKAKVNLGNSLSIKLEEIETNNNLKYSAEKILDEYKRLKNILSSD